METTVELPDDEAVEARLRAESARPLEPACKELAGQLAPLRKETRRIQQRIDAEFGQVDEEDT